MRTLTTHIIILLQDDVIDMFEQHGYWNKHYIASMKKEVYIHVYMAPVYVINYGVLLNL